VPGAPKLPPSLLARLRAERCVLVLGPGAASDSGGPTWRTAIGELAGRLGVDHLFPPASWSSPNAHVLTQLVTAELPQSAIAEVILRQAVNGGDAPRWLSNLADLPVPVVISLNWDDGLERTLAAREPLVVTPLDDVPPLEPQDERVLVFKPLGDVNKPASLSLSVQPISEPTWSRGYGRALNAVLSTHSALFLAATAADVLGLLATVGYDPDAAAHSHYALLVPDDESGIGERLLQSRYRTRLIPSDHDRPWVESTNIFTSKLARAVRNRRAAQSAPRATTLTDDALAVTKVELKNIGPFADLHVPVSETWTVILGDNASGKTALLRAVALTLAGDDVPAGAGETLLRWGARRGRIRVSIGETTYTTLLTREYGRVKVATQINTPVQTGELLALGVPALRGFAGSPLHGPQEERQSAGPDPADLEPLWRGGLDPRLEDLHQWLVNLAVVADGHVRSGDKAQARTQLESLFSIWERLTPGLTVRYAGLDTETWQIQVSTGDTVVPINTLSQGTLSTISWLGLLVRRLVQSGRRVTRGYDRRPAERSLLMVDELDAHLHPEWQKRVAPALQDLFPHLQVIATTHSPLIVGSLTAGEVLTLGRDGSGHGTVERSGGFRGWRADQILTSPAFGLISSRDERTAQLTDEYEQLLGLPAESLTDDQERRLGDLAQILGRSAPPTGETALERDATRLVERAIGSSLEALSPARRQALATEAQAYLLRLRSSEDH
jgi:hypothetical protein